MIWVDLLNCYHFSFIILSGKPPQSSNLSLIVRLSIIRQSLHLLCH
ncbi:hypothetical protein LINGRAHAP2_LOCUS31932 [Linum grandiflorum]